MPRKKAVKIDRINVEIIRSLQKDARTNFSNIAKSCGVSTDTISKRFHKMEKAGVIRGTTILMNPKKLGFDCIASLEIDVIHPGSTEVANLINGIHEIVFHSTAIGKFDLFCIAFLHSVERLNHLKDLIKGHPLVREITTSIWIDELLLCPENFEFEDVIGG